MMWDSPIPNYGRFMAKPMDRDPQFRDHLKPQPLQHRVVVGRRTPRHRLVVLGMGQNPIPLVNIKIAGKWMFIPLKMVCIGIDP